MTFVCIFVDVSKSIKISKILPDENNFNRHTDYGMELLNRSIDEVGVIESITISNDNKTISGNARRETMQRKFGKTDPIIVETDGTRPVILKRTDIKSGTAEFTKAALLANTVSKHNVNLDLNLIQEIAVEQFNIDIEEIGVTVMPDLYDEDFQENEDSSGTGSPKPETTGMIAISLDDDEHQQWLELKEKIKIPQDKKAFVHLIQNFKP